MNVLVIGSGGREHALCLLLSSEATVFCCPGNPGIAEIATCWEYPFTDTDRLLQDCGAHEIGLVVIGPEDPLIAGLADILRAAGFNVFGPGKDAAQLEGSKAFSKDIMALAGIRTAKSVTTSDFSQAVFAITEFFRTGPGCVVKASGNALGKGAVVCKTKPEAIQAAHSMLNDLIFGDAGKTVVIEEFLPGDEFSLLTLVSDGTFYSLPVAQDYKRAFDGNNGPNTGGMGGYSPVARLAPGIIQKTEEDLVAPLVRYLVQEKMLFRGLLFTGVMVHEGTPYCIEYNVRFGDPETQSVTRRITGGFLSVLLACARGEAIPPITISEDAAVTIVVASDGYPDGPKKGYPITLPKETPKNVAIFHAGTKITDGRLVNSGGRVFGVTATGRSLEDARALAYETAKQIHFQGAWFRSDIAK